MQHSLQEDDFLLQMPLFLSTLIFLGVIVASVKFIKDKYLCFALAWFVFSCIILFFCFLSVQRNVLWRNDINIYRDTLKYRPHDPKLHYNLGNAYLRKGLLNTAAKEYLIAIEGNPDYAYALNNLGLVFEKQGDRKAAGQHYEMAITSDPKLDSAKNNLLRFGFTSLAFAQDLYFDHSLYGEVLKKFVSDGKVDYASLRNNSFLLDKYLKAVAELDNHALNSMLRNEKIAFYLNVYNALTLKVIADYYPVKSVKGIPGVWDKVKFYVAGRELTLNQIEHQILRMEFKEPRIHFALVCASRGCPELADEPFNGKDLNERLEREARKFINDKTKVMLDKDNHLLYISSIFKWFSEDFGDIIKFVTRYLPEGDSQFVEEEKPAIKYLNYDWALNE